MEQKEFMKELDNKAKKMQIILTEKQLQDFYTYKRLLIEWNERVNLTAITDDQDIILKHFIDSLTVYNLIKENMTILDIGTGAGFPGIPLKIVKDKTNFVLMDSLNKRINFLNEVIKGLQLEKIQAIHGRAEEKAKEKAFREKFDITVSRAVASLNVLLEYMLPFTKVGGYCICMKSSTIDQELKEAEKALEILGGKIEKIEEIKLPNSDIIRKNVIIQKIKQTPNQYPRKAGTPSKNPIM